MQQINESTYQNTKNENIENMIIAKQNEISKISNFKRTLYEDWKNEDITREEYLEYKQKYENSNVILLFSMYSKHLLNSSSNLNFIFISPFSFTYIQSINSIIISLESSVIPFKQKYENDIERLKRNIERLENEKQKYESQSISSNHFNRMFCA